MTPSQHKQFSVVDESPPPLAERSHDTTTAMLALALRALSQKALIAVASLFTLTTCATVFWLALTVIPRPDPLQLAVLALYAAFVVALNFMVRR
jgi:hypothetical protein